MEILGTIIGIILWGCVWGFVTNKVIKNKGYEENWFWWGFFFGIFAVIVAATKPNVYATQVSVASNEVDQSIHNISSSIDKRALKNGDWKCTCGRVNPFYFGTCACGRSKRDVLEAQVKAQREKEAAREKELREKKEEQELANLKRLREYKELLDSGVITQEEFEAKKKEILG